MVDAMRVCIRFGYCVCSGLVVWLEGVYVGETTILGRRFESYHSHQLLVTLNGIAKCSDGADEQYQEHPDRPWKDFPKLKTAVAMLVTPGLESGIVVQAAASSRLQ